MKNNTSAIACLNAIAAAELGGQVRTKPVRHLPPDWIQARQEMAWIKKYRRVNKCGIVAAYDAWKAAHA